MFVDVGFCAVEFFITRLLRCARVFTGAALILSSGLACAEQEPLAPALNEAETTVPFALPTTGTITARHIGNGVWWQPVLNETSITQVLSDMNHWDVRNLYLDVFRSGHTLYPSEVFPQRPDALERDWLAYIISRAHEQNIRVHAWAQVLCWHEGDDTVATTHPLLAKHPDWLEVSVDGFAVDGKSAARYVCPGVPQVRETLIALADEISAYPIDGLNLDALEYNRLVDSGYNAVVVSEFETITGIKPDELRVDLDPDSDWMKWVAHREDSLTSVVQHIAERVQKAEESSQEERRIVLSAAVQPGYADSRGLNRRYQNWQQWLELDLLDATTPECFNPELPELEQQLWEARSMHMGTRVACIPGLQVNSGETATHPPLAEQKRLLRNAGFQFCTVLEYEGLREAMNGQEEKPEERSGFWNFLKKYD